MTSLAAPVVISRSRAVRRTAPQRAPIDWLIVAYASCALVVLGAHLGGWHDARPSRMEAAGLLIAHGLLFVLAALAPRARAAAASGRSFVAEWYALFVMSALYASVGLLNHPRELAAASFDVTIQAWEAGLFGSQVAYEWSRAMPSALLTWVLGLCYLAFYPLVLAAPGALWRRGRDEAARQTIFGVALAFFICYLLFLLFPVAGPSYWWGWPADPATAVWPAKVLRHLIEGGDAWGSAFPSSHVAASMATALVVRAHWPAAGRVFMALAIGIVLAVVYCQVHYALDAVAGLGVAFVASAAARRLCPARVTRGA